jgi:hypothetical protein
MQSKEISNRGLVFDDEDRAARARHADILRGLAMGSDGVMPWIGVDL